MLDFSRADQRRSFNSKKWTRFGPDVIPLPVADMDCTIAQPIQDAIQARVSHGIFGYDHPPADAMAIVTAHFRKHYDWQVDPDWIVPVAGVVPAQFAAQRAFATRPGTTPIPNPVYHSFPRVPGVTEHQAQPIEMRRDGVGRDVIVADDVARACRHSNGVAHLCNPHNPGGAVYDLAELSAIADAAREQQTVLVSDEIWADLILEDLRHIPMAKVAPDLAISILAATKTWNIAGLPIAFVVIPNAGLRAKFKSACWGIPTLPTCLGTRPWRPMPMASVAPRILDHLRAQRTRMIEFLSRYSELSMPTLQATYLAWIDCSALNDPTLHDRCIAAGIGPDRGDVYGRPGYLRFNLACSTEVLDTALQRFDGVLKATHAS